MLKNNHKLSNSNNTSTTKMKKNRAKGNSFAYAYKRINEALSQQFFLEAVTLAESVISDRLYSFASYHYQLANDKSSKSKRTKSTNLKTLIEQAKKCSRLTVVTKNKTDLFDALDSWRDKRNRCVHAVAKSEPGQPTISVEDFVGMCKETAEDGKYLARLVCDWHRRSQNLNQTNSKETQLIGHCVIQKSPNELIRTK